MRFQAFSDATLERLLYNHRLVRVQTLRRRAALDAWSYGSMTATGTRQPAGGRRADAYVPYAIHTGQTVEGIRALFRHAEVCLETVRVVIVT